MAIGVTCGMPWCGHAQRSGPERAGGGIRRLGRAHKASTSRPHGPRMERRLTRSCCERAAAPQLLSKYSSTEHSLGHTPQLWPAALDAAMACGRAGSKRRTGALARSDSHDQLKVMSSRSKTKAQFGGTSPGKPRAP